MSTLGLLDAAGLRTTLMRQEKQRFLTGDEMLASQILPVTAVHAKLSGAPQLQLQDFPNNVKGKMAGNSMSTLCCGTMLLVCILALEKL